MCTFVLAMVLNPDAYAKAQAEIDRVVGTDRLPEATDRGALPYVECLLVRGLPCSAPLLSDWLRQVALRRAVRSAARYRTLHFPHTHTQRAGVPHALSEYRIPKGRVIIPNMWCVRRVVT